MEGVLKGALKFLVTIGILSGGYLGFKLIGGSGDAVIKDMTTSGINEGARCWVDFEFKRVPEGINPSDLKIVFSGDIVEGGKIEYGWDFIGAHAQIPKKVGTGWEAAPGISAANPPSAGSSFSVNFPIPAKASMMSDADFDMVGTLYWGGKKQSSDIGSFRYQYTAGR